MDTIAPEPERSLTTHQLSWSGRFALLLAAALGALAFEFAGRMFALPQTADATVSLLQQASPARAMTVVFITMIVASLAGSVIAGWVRPAAGMMAATVGLSTLSMHGGTLRAALLLNGPATYLQLLIETAAMAVMLILVERIAGLLRSTSLVGDEDNADGFFHSQKSWGAKVVAFASSLVVMALAMMVLAQTDEKAQVLASVAIAGFLGTLAAHQIAPARPLGLFMSVPLVMAAIGYGLAITRGAPGWEIGLNRSVWAPLSRPMPIDYASLGVASAILGYWFSRSIHAASPDEED